MFCTPRFVYSGCADKRCYLIFYAATMPLHVTTALTYARLVYFSLPRTFAEAFTLANLMRVSVLGFSSFGALHHLSLLWSDPLFTRPLTELLYNGYCSLIFVALM